MIKPQSKQIRKNKDDKIIKGEDSDEEPTFFCPLCYKTLVIWKVYKTFVKDCPHKYCRECLVNYFKEHENDPIMMCPSQKCQEPIRKNVVENAIKEPVYETKEQHELKPNSRITSSRHKWSIAHIARHKKNQKCVSCNQKHKLEISCTIYKSWFSKFEISREMISLKGNFDLQNISDFAIWVEDGTLYGDRITLSNFRAQQHLTSANISFSFADLNINQSDLDDLKNMFNNIQITQNKEIVCSDEIVKNEISQLLTKVKLYNFPQTWEHKFKIAKDDQFEYQIFDLDKSSEEFEVLQREMEISTKYQIESIQRIQNKHLWYSYENEAKRLSKKLGQNSPELSLWHGTSKTPPERIIETGFDTSFSRDGAHGFGNYFTLDAKYCFGRFSHKNEDGTLSLLLALVLVGDPSQNVDSCRVQPQLKSNSSHKAQVPASRPPSILLPKRDEQIIERVQEAEERFDSVVSENMVVVYDNQKAYPQYLFKFKQL